eukprot:1151971-Pelagomonas_calceolata.AAC.2
MACIPYILEVLLWPKRMFLTISFKPMGLGGLFRPCMLTLPHHCTTSFFPLQPCDTNTQLLSTGVLFAVQMQHTSRISRCNWNRITELFACIKIHVLGSCRK